MTDTTLTPTDADIIALADETRTGEPGREGYILPISFARAVLAKWGTPAPASQPVGMLSSVYTAQEMDALREFRKRCELMGVPHGLEVDLVAALEEAGLLRKVRGGHMMTKAGRAALEATQASPVGMEPVYQIGQPFLFDPENTWRDASKDAYDVHMPNRRRIIYTAAQVQAMLAAAPRNATLYDPDDVAFPVQRSADGTDVPTELTSIAAAEVAAPSAPAHEPLTDAQIQEIWNKASGAIPGWSRHIAYARAIEAAHGITAAQKGGQHGTE